MLIKSRHTGKCWIISIIKKLWKFAWDIWDHCNKVLLEKDNAVVQSHQCHMDKTYQRLSTFVFARSDHYLTRLTLTQLLKNDSEYKKAWLKQSKAVIQIIRRSHGNTRQPPHIMLLGMRRSMARWLDSGRRSCSI
jgi:hypothetical protein